MNYSLPDHALANGAPAGALPRALLDLAPLFFKAVERRRGPWALLPFLAREPLLGRLRRENDEGDALTALAMLVERGPAEMIEALLPFSDANEDSGTTLPPFFRSLRLGRLAVAQALFPFVDPQAKDPGGRNAALASAASGNLDLLREAAKRCNPREAGENGIDALGLAARAGNADCVRFLLDFCDPRASDAQGKNPLHWAAGLGHSECVKLILANGGDPLAADANGDTPLTLACSARNHETVRCLLPVSDLNAQNAQGNTAADFALAANVLSVLEAFAPWLSSDELARAQKFHAQSQALRARRESLEIFGSMGFGGDRGPGAQSAPSAKKKARSL